MDPALLTTCAVIAVTGSIALVLSNVIGSLLVPGHDWVADTVSDLAAGQYEIVQDVGLYAFVAALLCCAVGAAHLRGQYIGWSLGTLALLGLGLCVTIIAARNEYGDGDTDGIVIHIYVVYAMGLLFAGTFLAMARGLGRIERWHGWASYGCAAVWAVGAPLFFFMPTSVDGIWERGLGLVAATWVVIFAASLRAIAQTLRGRH
jgi:hypothetical protein